MTVSDRLLGWRKKRGLSQAGAAKEAGITQAAWSNYENGEQIPRVDVAATLVKLTEDDPEHYVTFEMFAAAERERRGDEKGAA